MRLPVSENTAMFCRRLSLATRLFSRICDHLSLLIAIPFVNLPQFQRPTRVHAPKDADGFDLAGSYPCGSSIHGKRRRGPHIRAQHPIDFQNNPAPPALEARDAFVTNA